LLMAITMQLCAWGTANAGPPSCIPAAAPRSR
jgi:hypothetical protein